MRSGTSFARDWQLIKVARSIRRHDIARPLVCALLEGASPELMNRIDAISRGLGEEDGKALLDRSEEGFDPSTLMEGLLLMWGIPCGTKVSPDGSVEIVLGDTSSVKEAFIDEHVAVSYLTGYVRALQQGATLRRAAEGQVTIWFPARE